MELIDLGLPSGTKWASCNLGASQPTDYGNYYSWGGVSTQLCYSRRASQTYDLGIVSLKMEDFVNSNNVLSEEYDAAFQMLGEGWRIPSGEQAQELVDNCNWKWVEDYNGIKICGKLGISKINGAEIFLPAAGFIDDSNSLYVGRNGGYWTGAPNMLAENRAWSIAFDTGVINVFDHGLRFRGYSIRPVHK